MNFRCLNEISVLLTFMLACDTPRACSIAPPSADSNRFGINVAKLSYYKTGKLIVLKFSSFLPIF